MINPYLFTPEEFETATKRVYKMFGISQDANPWVRVRINRAENITIEADGSEAVYTIYKYYNSRTRTTTYMMRKLSKNQWHKNSSYILFRNSHTEDGYKFSSIEDVLDRFEKYVKTPNRRVRLFTYDHSPKYHSWYGY